MFAIQSKSKDLKSANQKNDINENKTNKLI